MKTLFDRDTPKREFTDITAQGFTRPVPGVVFTDEAPPCCGVPLGGIGTGCIDYDLRGMFGWSTIFNPHSQLNGAMGNYRVPRRYPEGQPIFGFSLGDKVYCLSTEDIVSGGRVKWCSFPSRDTDESGCIPQNYIEILPTPGVIPTKSIKYYGHFPVADAEYSFDAPISVGVRAWSSFIPGDSAKTNIPAAIFEVHLRNLSDTVQSGNLAMSFAGPNHQEARATFFTKRRVDEQANGLYVLSDGGVNYFLGVYDAPEALIGTGLAADKSPENGYVNGHYAKESGWGTLPLGLPQDVRFIEVNGLRKHQDPSASVAVPFSLSAGEEKVYEFVLTWYAPVFDSARKADPMLTKPVTDIEWRLNKPYGNESHLVQMYASRYDSALDVMRRLGRERGALLKKVLAWQEVLLTRESLPPWLRDSLMNILCLLTEDGYWFMPKYPLGDWAFPNGAFTYYESPRDCPHTSCIPNDWIGTMHLAYLFPDLFRQLLRAYKAVQRPDGEIPFALGNLGDVPNFTQPEYSWQMSLNGTCYIMMVDRLWVMTGDDSLLNEFYDSIKACHRFMSTMAKNGWLCIPDKGGSEWFEHSKFYGYTSHVGGLHLSQLLIVERLARKMGDIPFAEQCRRDYEETKRILDEKLWVGSHYMTWLDEETDRKNDDVMAYQLDGLFTNAQAGICEKMYSDERANTILDTIWASNVKLGNGYGALNYTSADGGYIAEDKDPNYGKYCIFTQNTIVLAMTALYCGQRERGLELAESTWRNLILKQGLGWDMTHIVHALDGHKWFGTDYNQQSVIWSLPAALEGTDVAGPLREGHLIADMLQACR